MITMELLLRLFLNGYFIRCNLDELNCTISSMNLSKGKQLLCKYHSSLLSTFENESCTRSLCVIFNKTQNNPNCVEYVDGSRIV